MSLGKEIPFDLKELARESITDFALQNSDSRVLREEAIKALKKVVRHPESDAQLKIFQQDVAIHRL